MIFDHDFVYLCNNGGVSLYEDMMSIVTVRHDGELNLLNSGNHPFTGSYPSAGDLLDRKGLPQGGQFSVCWCPGR